MCLSDIQPRIVSLALCAAATGRQAVSWLAYPDDHEGNRNRINGEDRYKEELLAEVARSLLAEVGHEQPEWSADWETRMIELSCATRRVALRHPNAAPLSLRFFPRRLMLPAYEAGLRDCPYPLATHMIVHEVIEKFTYGSSLFAAAAETHHIPAMPEVDAAHFPRLAEALEVAPSDEEIFRQGLQVLLAGLRARYGK